MYLKLNAIIYICIFTINNNNNIIVFYIKNE